MYTKDLEKDGRIVEWFINKPLANRTKEFYLDSMKMYTDYVEMNPSQLIAEAIEDIKSGKLMSERRIWNHIVKFRGFLIQKYGTRANGKPVSTVAYRMSAIKSFYITFEIDLPKSIKNGDTKPSPENLNMEFNVENIRRMLSYCAKTRERAIILTMKSSGLAAQEITNLTYRQFREGYCKDDGITTIRIQRAKVEVDFITFIDPEGSEAIIEYLKSIGRASKDGTLDSQYDDLPLFTAHRKPIRKMDVNTLTGLFRYMAIKMKTHKPTERGKKYKMNPDRSHNLRKFFNTQLKNNGMNSDTVEFLMGHTGDKTKSTYYLHDVQKLKEQYQNNMPALMIYSDKRNVDLIKSNTAAKIELEQSQMEIARLRAKLKQLEGRDMDEKENMLSLLDDFRGMIETK